MAFRKVVLLLHRLAEADAKDAAVLYRNKRHVRLVRRGIHVRRSHLLGRLLRTVQKRKQTAHTVRVEGHHHAGSDSAGNPRRDKVAKPHSRHEHDKPAGRADDHHRTEVGLLDDEQRIDSHKAARNDKALDEQFHAPGSPVEPDGEHDHDGELCEFARLHVDRPELYPAERPVDLATTKLGKDEQQKNGHRDIEQPCEAGDVAPSVVVEKSGRNRDDDAYAEVDELPLHEEVGVLV